MDLAKVQAIRDMPTPQTEKQTRSFLGKVNYIAHFIAQLTTICDLLFKLLKKDTKIEGINECQTAFDKIKQYLLNPPCSGSPNTKISIDPLRSDTRNLHGLHVRPIG